MIQTHLTREAALKIIELGKQLHSESHFNHEPFNPERCWQILDGTLSHPEKLFIAYDDQFRGFVLMTMNEHYFSGIKRASDLALYIDPKHRGGFLVVRLLKEVNKWAKGNGAQDVTIFHNTGIDTEKAPQLFKKLGFDMKGYIFTKEIK